jgi:DNA repair exonuclease SbcCD nuclease subunit
MKQYGMTMDIIPGNHDVFHKNTNSLCSLKELLGYYTSCINIIMKPSTINYDGCDIHLLPWINPENHEHSMDFIKKNKGILMAHLELADFEMMRGIKQPKGNGMGVEPFKHYDLCLSGHYHASSQQGNIRYLGCQMEFTWADAHDQKHFHIFDTDTKTIEAIPNPLRLFEKIYYDDTVQDYSNFDINTCTGKFVKVIVGNKSNPFMFDKLIERISELDTHDLKIAENFSEFLGDNVVANIEDVENTTDLMASYIDGVNTDLDKDKLKTLMNSLYNDAIDMEIQ